MPRLTLEALEDRTVPGFLAPVTYAVGENPQTVAVGDFNHDGKLDLVVENVSDNTVSVLLGNGNGTFQNAVNYATGLSPEAVTVGVFTGDGNLDIVIQRRRPARPRGGGVGQ
jgi:hypothetical protein